jgi:hypothetical protein
MDIPDDAPKRGKTKAQKLPVTDGDVIIASLAGEAVAAQGSVSVLSFMRARHEESERVRNPGRGEPSEEAALSGIEEFLTNDHKSHLSRIVELEQQIEKSRRAVEIIDETDFSGRTLYDFIPDEVKAELDNRLVSLKDRASIRTSVEGELSSLCGDLWHDYRSGREKTAPENEKLRETLLLGPTPTAEEQKDLKGSTKILDEVETMAELIGLEKVRLVVRALTAGTKDYDTKAADAEKILGPEFGLIKEQVAHMEASLEMDYSKGFKGEGETVIPNPTQGNDLFCKGILDRMEPTLDKDGKPTRERKISPEQLDVLDSAYLDAIARKKDGETPRDRVNRKIGFILAATEMLEIGKRARAANLLKTVRELENPEISLGEETTPERRRLSQWIREKGVGLLRNMVRLPKKGVGAALKAAPQALVIAVAAKSWKHSQTLHEKHYGANEEFLQFMKTEALGEANTIT